MAPDVEVAFDDLPVDALGLRFPASEELDVEVRRMREALVVEPHDWTRPGGAAVEAIVLRDEERVRFAIPARCWGAEPEVVWGSPTRASGFELVPVGDDEQTSPHRQRVPAAASRWAVRRLLERRLMTVEAALERVGQLREPGAAGRRSVACWMPGDGPLASRGDRSLTCDSPRHRGGGVPGQ